MKTVKFLKPFGFAENGIHTLHFSPGQVLAVSDSCADSAVQVGAAEYEGKRELIVGGGKKNGKKS